MKATIHLHRGILPYLLLHKCARDFLFQLRDCILMIFYVDFLQGYLEVCELEIRKVFIYLYKAKDFYVLSNTM